MKKLLAVTLLSACFMNSAFAQIQDTWDVQRHVVLPDIPGYKTLKCDFHMHTLFSDGHVWPSFRVNEALRDDLDAISLTEHTDYKEYADDIPHDLNRSYDLATAYVKKRDAKLIIVKGAEISPRVQPYHNNALFLTNSNLPFDYMKVSEKQFIMKEKPTHAELMAPFIEAKKQGAFIVMNHPGNMPAWDVHDTTVFTNFHKELYAKKMLAGIEVANSGIYNVTAHRLAMQYNLTMMCNTDEHFDMYPRYQKTHRPMTLVFAKERTPEAIKEALIAGRTACYFDDYLVMRQPLAEAFFKAAVSVKTERGDKKGEPLLLVKMTNNSDVPFKVQATGNFILEKYPTGQVTLAPHAETVLSMRGLWHYPAQIALNLNVSNILVTPDAGLQTQYMLATK